MTTPTTFSGLFVACLSSPVALGGSFCYFGEELEDWSKHESRKSACQGCT